MSDHAIKTISTFIITEHTDEDGLLHSVEVFNSNGNLIVQETYEDGDLVQTIEREYDAEGNVTDEYIYTDYDEPDQVMTYGKDSQNRHVLTEISYADSSASHFSYHIDGDTETILVTDDDGNQEQKEIKVRDADGNLIGHFQYDEANKLVSSSELTYDDNGRVLTSIATGPDGRRMKLRYEYTFDDETGRVVGVDAFDDADKLIRADTFEFDAAGNIVALYTEDTYRGIRSTELRTYDEQGRVTRLQNLDENDLPRQDITHAYNALGLLVEKEVRTPEGVVLYRNEYEFFVN